MIIEDIKKALESLDEGHCFLSDLDYLELLNPEKAAEAKLLERPFAYEFYHQFRTQFDKGDFDIGDCVLQGEVAKRYQHIPGLDLGKIPDFIIHKPGTNKNNLAVIEFKLATNPARLFCEDFDKLLKFKKKPLKYNNLIEVIIGNKPSLESAQAMLDRLRGKSGEEIVIIWFDATQLHAYHEKIRYHSNTPGKRNRYSQRSQHKRTEH